jgi:hypothetical protein
VATQDQVLRQTLAKVGCRRAGCLLVRGRRKQLRSSQLACAWLSQPVASLPCVRGMPAGGARWRCRRGLHCRHSAQPAGQLLFSRWRCPAAQVPGAPCITATVHGCHLDPPSQEIKAGIKEVGGCHVWEKAGCVPAGKVASGRQGWLCGAARADAVWAAAFKLGVQGGGQRPGAQWRRERQQASWPGHRPCHALRRLCGTAACTERLSSQQLSLLLGCACALGARGQGRLFQLQARQLLCPTCLEGQGRHRQLQRAARLHRPRRQSGPALWPVPAR